jgi:hypothetical protein
MGYFYIDDSVHDQAGFIVGACIYAENDISDAVVNIIETNGFKRDEFEFKSSTRYSNQPQMIPLRHELKSVIRDYCKLGIIVVPREHRKIFGVECLKGIKQFIDNNKRLQKSLNLFFDQGLFTSAENARKEVDLLNFKNCSFYFEQDSKKVYGIQIADLAAHISSIQLKDKMGLVTKMVKVGEGSGYDPNMEVRLGFEMWATLRHSFFNQGGRKHIEAEGIREQATLDVEPSGLYVSEFCNAELSAYARKAFAKVYLGCIH